MTNELEVMNSLTPMAYLPPHDAYQYQIGTYVMVGTAGAFVWDIVENIYDDYRLAFQHKLSFPTIVYFLSRFSVLASTLINTILRTAPLGAHLCQNVQFSACILSHVALASTAFLFFLRARAVFANNTRMTVFFFSLWFSVVAGSVTVTLVGGSGPLGPTDYCLAKPMKPYIAVSPVTLFLNDTCVFLAISYRLMSLAGSKKQKRSRGPKDPIRRFVLGRDLPVLSRTLFMDGQVYYLVSIVSNIVGIITITPLVPSGFRYMYIFNSAITNMMACRVYRHTKFGDFGEGAIQTAIWISPLNLEAAKPDFARFSRHDNDAPTTANELTILSSVTIPEDGEKRQDLHWSRFKKWRSRILFISIAGLMILIPVICISVCTHPKQMPN